MNLIDVEKLNDAMMKLAIGVDPTTGIKFSNDTILNNKVLQDMFSKTSDILQDILDGTLVKKKHRRPYKKVFHILYDDSLIDMIVFPEGVTISKFVYRINEKVNIDRMKKLRAVDITTWLAAEGYLQITQGDAFRYKTTTEKGKAIGITTIIKKTVNGDDYSVNVYNLEAQEFILKNINIITGYESGFLYTEDNTYEHQTINR